MERIPYLDRRKLPLPSLEEARISLGGKLPSVFEKYQFPEPGIVLTDQGPKVPVYVASGLGFNFAGRFFLEHYVHPKLEQEGAFILDPFQICGELLDLDLLDDKRSLLELKRGWQRFNNVIIHTVNYRLAIPRSGLVFAICEGYPVDEGMASEMAYAATNFCPVVAVRSDFRLSENVATGTNPAVHVFASSQYGGSYYENSIADQAYQSAFSAVRELIDRRLRAWGKEKE